MEDERPLALVIDDNLMFATMLEPALRQLGYRPRTLGWRTESAAAAAGSAPALIFVNLASGRHPGDAVVRSLRAEERLAGVPIIGYAGHVERDLLRAGLEAGATLVVPNSAVRQALPEVLEKLRRVQAGEAAPME